MATKLKGVRLTDGQRQVYNALKTFGPMPDQALVPLAQHAAGLRQSSSGIRTRRKELINAGLVVDTGKTTQTSTGRAARVYKAVV